MEKNTDNTKEQSDIVELSDKEIDNLLKNLKNRKTNKLSLNDEELYEYEKIIKFWKYVVLFFLSEALKKEKFLYKNRTESREREKSIKETKEWFCKQNKILKLYCELAMVDIEKIMDEYEYRKKNNISDDYIRSKFSRKLKKTTLFDNN